MHFTKNLHLYGTFDIKSSFLGWTLPRVPILLKSDDNYFQLYGVGELRGRALE